MASKKCALLALPREIRDEIYELSFIPDDKLQSIGNSVDLLKATPPSSTLLLTCRQVYKEAKPLYITAYHWFWTESHFVVSTDLYRKGTSLPTLLEPLRDSDLQSIEHLELNLIASGYEDPRENGIYNFALLPNKRSWVLDMQDPARTDADSEMRMGCVFVSRSETDLIRMDLVAEDEASQEGGDYVLLKLQIGQIWKEFTGDREPVSSTTGPEKANRGECGLLTLPRELRDEIYELSFTADDEEINLLDCNPPSKSLLLACRQFCSEAKTIYTTAYRQFWSEEYFVINADHEMPLPSLLEPLRDSALQHIQHLDLKCRAPPGDDGFAHFSLLPNKCSWAFDFPQEADFPDGILGFDCDSKERPRGIWPCGEGDPWEGDPCLLRQQIIAVWEHFCGVRGSWSGSSSPGGGCCVC